MTRQEWKLSGVLAALIINLVPTTAHGQQFVTAEQALRCGEDLPLAFGDLQLLGDSVEDTLVRVEILEPLLEPQRIALYGQQPLLTPTITDRSGYVVVVARQLSSFEDVSTGGFSVTFGMPTVGKESERPRQRSSGFKALPVQPLIFKFDYSGGLWVAQPSVFDSSTEETSTLVFEPGLYGLGFPASVVAVPLISTPVALALVLLMALGGCWALRGRMHKTGALTLVGGMVLALAALAGKPEVTSPGNQPIRHTEKVEYDEQEGRLAGEAVTFSCITQKLWIYDGDGDPTELDNWEVVPQTRYFLKTDLTTAPEIEGAAPKPEEYDTDKYPFFDCAGFAFRESAFTPLQPDVDGRAILENEYDCIGAATGDSYKTGDVVTYVRDGKITHFAVVTEVDEDGKITKLESKWGKLHVMEHELTSVPGAYGPPDQVYRKKT